MKTGQQGAGLLIPVLLIVTVAAFAVIVAASQSGSDIQGTDANADSIQALYLAETGVERALKRFATGTACGALLAQTITDLSTIGLGTTAYTITILAGLTTDFSGVTALPTSQCRVRVTGTINATNVSRTIHAIVDRNLLDGVNNNNFNNPTNVVAPSSWVLSPGGTYAQTGGPEITAPCNRSAWLLKAGTDPAVITRGQGQTTLPAGVTVTGGTVTAVTFRYRVNDRGPPDGGCAVGASSGAAFFPAACDALPAPPGGTEASVCFQTTDSLGTISTSVRWDTASTAAVLRACVAGADPGTPTTTFATCATGYPATASRNMTVAGAGTRTITTFRYHLRLVGASRREIFLDNIQAVNNTAIGAARVQVWRDCSTAPCP